MDNQIIELAAQVLNQAVHAAETFVIVTSDGNVFLERHQGDAYRHVQAGKDLKAYKVQREDLGRRKRKQTPDDDPSDAAGVELAAPVEEQDAPPEQPASTPPTNRKK